MIWPSYPWWAPVVYGALVAAAVALAGLAWRRRAAHMPGLRFPARHRLEGVRRGWRARLVGVPFWLRLAALALLLFALTRPQRSERETADVEGIDIVVALDLSGSMSSVDISDEDLARLQSQGREPSDRFHIAIATLQAFIDSRQYDRIGLVAFGKEAFLMFPLTLDYGVMHGILDRMQLKDIDGSATAIGNALAMSLARLAESEAKTRLIILLTDGEDQGSNVSPVEMAREAARRGVHVFPILVGSEDESRRPSDMVDLLSGQRLYQRSDSRVNPRLLAQIADITEGTFYRATDQESLQHDFQSILDRFEKTRLVDYASAERSEIYHWFLLPGLGLLLLEVLLSQTLLRRFP